MHGVILLAAGSGSRMDGFVKDKILANIQGSNAFRLSLQAFSDVSAIRAIIIVFRDEEQRVELMHEVQHIEKCKMSENLLWVKGGEQRKDSVMNGLLALPDHCEFAHIHDCARPLIRSETIEVLVKAVHEYKPITVSRPVTNTIRRVLANSDQRDSSRKTQTLDRNELWEMETPQSAPKNWLIEGYERAEKLNLSLTDDMQAIELIEKKILLHEPSYPNPKITYPQDLKLINFLLSS
ncbi:MAG: IspD/TarI family cytidylyltransferase [Verrucomicrobiota bacterium]|nr:IspD/TarI family cytidylyltransferase [Verrucomicrobiota bacterium]